MKLIFSYMVHKFADLLCPIELNPQSPPEGPSPPLEGDEGSASAGDSEGAVETEAEWGDKEAPKSQLSTESGDKENQEPLGPSSQEPMETLLSSSPSSSCPPQTSRTEDSSADQTQEPSEASSLPTITTTMTNVSESSIVVDPPSPMGEMGG